MNIKDAEVRSLVEELARRRKTTMTDAVRQAVNEALVHDRESDSALRRSHRGAGSPGQRGI